MRHQKSKKTLDRKSSPRKALIKGLAINLILAEKIKTTDAKARVLRSFVEKIITFSKKNDLASRRKIMRYLNNREVTQKLLEKIGPRYISRPGGYTRIIKLKQRKGDAAKVAIIEFV